MGVKVIYDILGDVIARQPGHVVDRLTPWLLFLLGGLMILLMLYAFISAPSHL